MEGIIKILRFNPKVDKEPYYKEYNYAYKKGITVLDVLSYSYCFRNGHSRICGLTIDEWQHYLVKSLLNQI